MFHRPMWFGSLILPPSPIRACQLRPKPPSLPGRQGSQPCLQPTGRLRRQPRLRCRRKRRLFNRRPQHHSRLSSFHRHLHRRWSRSDRSHRVPIMPGSRAIGPGTAIGSGLVADGCYGPVPPRSGWAAIGRGTAAAGYGSAAGGDSPKAYQFLPQHCLYFLPLRQGQGSLRPTFGPIRTGLAFSTAAAASLTMSLPCEGPR